MGLGLGFKRQELWSQNQTFLSSKLIGRRRHEAGGAQLLTENQEDSTVSTEEEARGGADRDEGRKELSLPSLSLAGCLHLYYEAIEYSFNIENRASPRFQPLSINALCMKEVFLVSSLSMCLALLHDQPHSVQGPWQRKTWGLVQKPCTFR